MDIKDLMQAVKDGTLEPEVLAELKALLKPESEAAKKKKAALDALETYLDLSIEDAIENGAETVRDVFKDIQELQAAIKACGGTRVKHASKKWSWVDKEKFLIALEDGTELSVDPRNGDKWIPKFEAAGYTAGQVAAVRKTRPYRKGEGVISLDRLEEILKG